MSTPCTRAQALDILLAAPAGARFAVPIRMEGAPDDLPRHMPVLRDQALALVQQALTPAAEARGVRIPLTIDPAVGSLPPTYWVGC